MLQLHGTQLIFDFCVQWGGKENRGKEVRGGGGRGGAEGGEEKEEDKGASWTGCPSSPTLSSFPEAVSLSGSIITDISLLISSAALSLLYLCSPAGTRGPIFVLSTALLFGVGLRLWLGTAVCPVGPDRAERQRCGVRKVRFAGHPEAAAVSQRFCQGRPRSWGWGRRF